MIFDGNSKKQTNVSLAGKRDKKDAQSILAQSRKQVDPSILNFSGICKSFISYL